MKKPLVVKFVALLLCFVVLVPYIEMYVGRLTEVFAVTDKEIQDAKDAQAAVDKQIADTQKEINSLKQQSENTAAYLATLDQKMANVDGELYTLNQQIAAKEVQIGETKTELEKAEADATHQYDMMKLRIKFMYEQNEDSYLALMLAAESLADMLNRVEYVTKISEYDRQMLDEYQATVEYVAAVKVKLETELAELQDSKLTAEKKKAELEVLQKEKATELAAYNTQIAQLEEKESELHADADRLEAIAKELEEKKRQEELQNGGSNLGTSTNPYESGFIWPTISRRITSRYGATNNRPHPHTGVDIGAVKPGVWGDPIYAAADGEVTLASYDSGAGYWIWIYHGNSMYTVYMHCSKFYVKVGDKVKQGDTIALMGSTGNSTGAHLHFSVRLNGQYVNPEPYIGIK